MLRNTVDTPNAHEVIDVVSHLVEMFGVSFYQLVLHYSHENNAEFMLDNEISSDAEQNQLTLEEREERFEQNKSDVMSGRQL